MLNLDPAVRRAAKQFSEAIQVIDQRYAPDYARKNPQVLASFLAIVAANAAAEAKEAKTEPSR